MEFKYELLYLCFILSVKYLEYCITNDSQDCAHLTAPFSIFFNWLFLVESLNTIEYANELLGTNMLRDPYSVVNLSSKIFNSLMTYEFVDTSDKNHTISPTFLKGEALVLSVLAITILIICNTDN